MKKRQKIEVIQKPDELEVPAKIIAQSIKSISDSMKAIAKSGLKREAIVILIKDKSGISKQDINVVMNNLELLAENYLTR